MKGATARAKLKYNLVVSGIVAWMLAIAGCRNPSVAISNETAKLDHSWERRAQTFFTRETRALSWTDAIGLLRERNPELRKADEERFKAKRGIGQVYRNLLPFMQLRVGIDRRVEELDTLSFQDVRLDLNAYAFLSGLVSLRRDVYAAELTYLRSTLMRELTLREKTAELYRLFIASRQLQIARQRLVESERVLRDIPVQRRALESAPATVEALRDQLRSLEARLDGDLVKLLDLSDFCVELIDRDLPQVDYAKAPLDVRDASRVGVLRRKLFAIELVGAHARVSGATLQYWPDISLFLTSGSLWTTSNGQTVWWNSNDLSISASAYLPIDLNGSIRNRVRDAKWDMDFLRREIDMRESIFISEFEEKHRALIQVERELLEQERKRNLLMQLISIEGAENLGERLRQWSEIELKRENAVDQRAQLNAFFLFFDELFWPVPSAIDSTLPVASSHSRP